MTVIITMEIFSLLEGKGKTKQQIERQFQFLFSLGENLFF